MTDLPIHLEQHQPYLWAMIGEPGVRAPKSSGEESPPPPLEGEDLELRELVRPLWADGRFCEHRLPDILQRIPNVDEQRDFEEDMRAMYERIVMELRLPLNIEKATDAAVSNIIVRCAVPPETP